MTPEQTEATAANLLIRARAQLVGIPDVPAIELCVDIDDWLSASRMYDTAARADALRTPVVNEPPGMPMHLSVAVLNAASAFARTLDREVPAIETADVVQDLRDACAALLEVMRP